MSSRATGEHPENPHSDPAELRAWITERLAAGVDAGYAQSVERFAPGLRNFTGVPVPRLRKIAREANINLKLTPNNWTKYLSEVIPGRNREEILVGIFGLGRSAAQLDDLFGERVSGWARELDNWETTDQLSVPVGAWVLADMSRVGYLEAWAVIGETVWKRRLGVVATVQLNHGGHSHPAETFQVVRHVMETRDRTLAKAAGWAIREVSDPDAVERFLLEWASLCSRSLLTQAMKKLPEEYRERIRGTL